MRVGLDARLVGPGLGISTLIGALADGLPRRGVEVVWFGEPTRAPDSVSEVVALPGPGFGALDSSAGRRLARGLGLDLMHFPGNSGWWSPGSVPHVVTVHDLMWGQWWMRGRRVRQLVGHTYLRLAVPRAIRGAAAVTVPSATTAAALRARYGVDPDVIHNGIDGRWWNAPAKRRTDTPYLVAFSARDPRKATEISIDAWEHVAGRGVRLVLLAGAGIEARLRGRIAELAKGGALELRRYEPLPRLIEVVAAATALIYPSREEGFGLPVLESMAAGVPVITGLAPVTLEIGGDAVLRIGRADPARDAAAHVVRLLDEPDLLGSLARRGQERAAAFTWDRALDTYRALYERVLTS